MSTTKIVSITRQQEDEVAALMAHAFAGDALMRYLFEAGEESYTARLRGFFRYTCAVHRQLKWPVLGAVARTRLAGVVCLATPEQAAWTAALDEAFATFTKSFSSKLLERMQRYAALPSRGVPDVPHCYIKAIGVRPESQGRGYAHALLDAVHQFAEAHPTAQGVGLDTEKSANVPLYENFGYKLVATVPFDGIDVFYMFRNNQG